MVMPWLAGAPFDPLNDCYWSAEPGPPADCERPGFDSIPGHFIPEAGTILTLAVISEEVNEVGLGFVYYDRDVHRWSRFCATAPIPEMTATWAPYALRSCGFLHTCLELGRIEVTQEHIEQLASEIGVVRCRKDPRLDPVVPIEW